jgi:hypothetical protein
MRPSGSSQVQARVPLDLRGSIAGCEFSRLRSQLSQLSIPAIEQGGGLTVCGEVVIHEGGEPRDAVTQERVLSPMPSGGTLCPRLCGLWPLMPAKGV